MEQEQKRYEDHIAGRNAVTEALKSGRPLDSVLVAKGEEYEQMLEESAELFANRPCFWQKFSKNCKKHDKPYQNHNKNQIKQKNKSFGLLVWVNVQSFALTYLVVLPTPRPNMV